MDRSLLKAEALCGSGYLLTKSGLTEDEKDTLRAAEIKARWLERMMAKGLAAQLAFDGGTSVGFIEYMPVELSIQRRGEGLYQVNCMVAPHTPPWSKEPGARIPGCGTALVNAMIEDVKDRCSGIIGAANVAYSDTAGFFAKLGFESYEDKGQKWLIRKFAPFELPEKVTYEDRYRFHPIPGRVVVDTFWSSHCPPGTLVQLRDVCQEFGDRVILNEYCLDEREELAKYGVDFVTYFNGQSRHWSWELSSDKIREILKTCIGESS